MSGLGPSGGVPTSGILPPAGSGDWLVSGTSSAIFLNGASYISGVLFSAAGSGASFVGAGHVTNTFYDAIYSNLISTDQVTPPAPRMIYSVGSFGIFGDTLSIAPSSQVGLGLHMTQAMTYGGASSYVWTAGANIVEAFRLTEHPSAAVYMHVAMTQKLTMAHSQVVSLLASISETMVISPLLHAYLGSVLLTRMLMSDTLGVQMKYAVSETEVLHIASTYQRFAGAFVNESLSVGGNAAAAYRAVAAITEFMTLALSQHYIMAFRLHLADGLDITDAEALRMIYRQSLTEVIDLEILYQSPNGNISSWAINTRTGAVTEYQGWSFNSFVQIGNKYLAANKDGLYELNGPSDAGLSTVADIVGAFLQPAGGHLSGLKGVYLGQTGQGYWLLKIQTGDEREYVYQRLANPGLMTTKFTIGKGINARYIGWELINVEGQDFDIDTVEFVPMLRTRRV